MIERPTTTETLNHGQPSVPRQSACVILLRDGEEGIEILLVRRNPRQRFMGGFWVFPGGAVDAGDGEGDGAHRAAAVRELEEEAGVSGVAPADLVKYSRWITPELIEIRFDTQFFLARVPEGVEARVDGAECVDVRWTTPIRALEDHAGGGLALAFPTLRQLDELSRLATVDELLARGRDRDVQPVQPKIVLTGETARVLLPGEPGYDASVP
ncbi:MAG TPA: NUDIX hydrolase [Solirubrobacteraceae bacterium]|jgi:8-oxo-dGTP pyrophosphatase MutT (NUDIX family)